ncbi:hypothetical protein EV188_107199 [Actinomycetospora succinea]|uniref:Uncharacterized protein n=1 Tax=Actinomycetospora succinea TaxID=663603 RepID=A0A4R6UZ31_9PSEU|nr:hypothetical protein [Actinomycetospora succinea]TDQ52822.1 hypothetical protein EV188_107199 [Actinomycetospora succinea]
MSVITAPAAIATSSRAKTRGLAVVGAGAAALAGWSVGALLGADYWITDSLGTARVDIPAAVGTTIITALLA